MGTTTRTSRRLRAAAAALAALALGVLAILGRAAPAGADGLDFLCSTQAQQQAPSEPIADVRTPQGVNLSLTFDGIDSNGKTIHRDKPLVMSGWHSDGSPQVGTATGVNVDNPGLDDTDPTFKWWWAPRLSTSPSPWKQTQLTGGTNPLDGLFNKNFQVPDDFKEFNIVPTNWVSVGGIDLLVEHPLGKYDQYKGRFGIYVELLDAKKAVITKKRISLAIDSTDKGAGPGSAFPYRSRLSVVFRSGQFAAPGDPAYMAFGQSVVFAPGDPDLAPALAKPLAVGLQVDTPDQNWTPKETDVAVTTKWSKTPHYFGLGARTMCKEKDAQFRSTSHLSTYSPDNIAGADLGLDLETGLGKGIAKTPETSVHGRFARMPQQVDLVMHPDEISISRSPETPTTVQLDRVSRAVLAAQGQPPRSATYLAGRIDDMPRHFDVKASWDDKGTPNDSSDDTFQKADVGLYDLACPGQGNPENDAVPLYPLGCKRTGFAAATRAQFAYQDFVPEDPDAKGATADFPATPAGTHVLYARRDARPAENQPMSYMRLDLDLPQVKAGGFDKTGTTADTTNIHVAAESGGANDAKVVLYSDGRTSADEVKNAGTLVDARGTARPLPASLDIGYHSSPLVPVLVKADVSTAFALAGRATVQMAGPDAREVLADFDVGGNGGDGLAKSFQLGYWRGPDGAPHQHSSIGYSASSKTHVKAGLVTSTLAERFPNPPVRPPWRLRAYADAVVPDRLNVAWTSHNQAGWDPPWKKGQPKGKSRWYPAGAFQVKATACSVALNCTNSVDATLNYGPGQKDDATPLAGAPLLPEQDFLHPAFTPIGNGGEGIRFLYQHSSLWGVRAAVRNLTSLDYLAGEGQEVCVKSNPTGNPFVANVYYNMGPQLGLYANATLSGLPGAVYAKIDNGAAPANAPATTPWIYVNTQSCAVTQPPNAPPVPGPEPASPRLDAVVRVGNPWLLENVVGEPARQGNTDRIDAVANLSQAQDVWGLDAHVLEHVPDYVAVYPPRIATCNADTPAFKLAKCQGRQHYEIDQKDSYGLDFRSGRVSLGPLTAQFVYSDAKAKPLYVVNAVVGQLPGWVKGGLDMVRNRRLPWTDAKVHFDGNVALGSVGVEVFDERTPGYRGDEPNRALPANKVPKYKVSLANATNTLDVDARLRFSETPDEAVNSQKPLCKSRAEAGSAPYYPPKDRQGGTGLGYLRASIDLKNQARAIDIGMRSGLDREPNSDQARIGPGLSIFDEMPKYAISVRSDARLDADVNAKMVNMGLSQVEGLSAMPIAPIPIGSFRMCLDFDLPIEVNLRNAGDVRLGVGSMMALDISQADAQAGGTLSGRVHETYDCQQACPNNQVGVVDRNGAPYAYRYVHFDPFWNDWKDDFPNPSWKDVAVVNPDIACDGGVLNANDIPCYDANRAPDNVVDWGKLSHPNLNNGYDRGQFVADVVWGHDSRMAMWSRDMDHLAWFTPGGDLYTKFGQTGPPPTDFRIPELQPAPVTSSGSVDDCTAREWNPELKKLGKRVTGPDGTTYETTIRHCGFPLARESAWAQPVSYGFRPVIVVVARFPDEQIRWRHVMAFDTPGNIDDKSMTTLRYGYAILPQSDGYLTVLLNVGAYGNNGLQAEKTYSAYVDASGYGSLQPLQGLPTLTATVGEAQSFSTDTGGPLPVGAKTVMHWGDGETVETVQPALSHKYSLTGVYLMKVMGYDTAGKIVGEKSYKVVVGRPPPSPWQTSASDWIVREITSATSSATSEGTSSATGAPLPEASAWEVASVGRLGEEAAPETVLAFGEAASVADMLFTDPALDPDPDQVAALEEIAAGATSVLEGLWEDQGPETGVPVSPEDTGTPATDDVEPTPATGEATFAADLAAFFDMVWSTPSPAPIEDAAPAPAVETTGEATTGETTTSSADPSGVSSDATSGAVYDAFEAISTAVFGG